MKVTFCKAPQFPFQLLIDELQISLPRNDKYILIDRIVSSQKSFNIIRADLNDLLIYTDY
jgi:hypothetical protein